MGIVEVLKFLGNAYMSYAEDSINEKFRSMSNSQLKQFVSDMEQKEGANPQLLARADEEMRKRKLRRD